ncbi:hypothetical protein ABK040_007963 [Willaertia magna]
MSKLLIVGATGIVGQSLIKSLNDEMKENNNLTIKVITRDGNKAKSLFEKYENIKIEYLEGDVSSENNYSEWMKDVERMFLLTPSFPQQVSLEQLIIHSALTHGKDLKQIVRLSGLGTSADRDSNCLLKWHFDSEVNLQQSLKNFNEKNNLQQQSISFVILRPNSFMQNFLVYDREAIKQGVLYYIKPDVEGRDFYVSHVDSRDVGEFAAKILIESIEDHANNTYNITGPQSLSFPQLTSIISKALGKEIIAVPIEEEQLFASMNEYPLWVRWMMLKLAQLGKTNGVASHVNGDFKIVMGKEARSVENFFEEFKNDFL